MMIDDDDFQIAVMVVFAMAIALFFVLSAIFGD